MQNSLLHVVWTEMCVGSVCTHPPYNDKNPPGAFFLIPINNNPFLKSSRCFTAGAGVDKNGSWAIEVFCCWM